MTPRTQLLLLRLALLAGGLLCFGAVMAAYTALGINLPLLPLWVNLAALITPILLGMFLGYRITFLLPLVCPSCREPIDRHRVEPTRWWRPPTYRFWCDRCERDGMDG
jgi:hypothetical protein